MILYGYFSWWNYVCGRRLLCMLLLWEGILKLVTDLLQVCICDTDLSWVCITHTDLMQFYNKFWNTVCSNNRHNSNLSLTYSSLRTIEYHLKKMLIRGGTLKQTFFSDFFSIKISLSSEWQLFKALYETYYREFRVALFGLILFISICKNFVEKYMKYTI